MGILLNICQKITGYFYWVPPVPLRAGNTNMYRMGYLMPTVPTPNQSDIALHPNVLGNGVQKIMKTAMWNETNYYQPIFYNSMATDDGSKFQQKICIKSEKLGLTLEIQN